MAAAFRHLLKACLPSDAHESPPATRQNSVNEEQSREADSKALFAGEDPNRQASTSTALPEYEPRSQESEEQQKQIIYDEPEGENQGSEPPEMEQPKIITSSPVATAQDTELQLHQSPVSDNDSSQPAPIVAESPDEVGPDPERQSPWKRPILERLPSESLSASSETSQQSDTNEPDSSLPDQTPQKQAKRPKPLQQFSESKQLSSGLLNPDTSLSSSFGHISEPSTPQGFLRHRHSTSLNSAREVRETLDAYMPTPSDEEPDGPENPATYNRTRRCNQYRIGRPLGKGSAASVYVAEDDQGNAFACKEFSKSMLRRRKKSELLRARRGGRGPLNQLEKQEKNDPLTLVRTEIAIMKKLHHPNLVQLHEVLDVPDNDSLFLMMELCNGGPLTSISVNQGANEPATAVPEADALNWTRQLLLAIEYLHENDVVHRDIKPENILFATKNRVICKIVDFGVSEMFRSPNDDRSTKAVGSPAFMSPELIQGNKSKGGFHGRPADIWALGVTLFCLCAGHLPFHSANYLELNDLILHEAVKIPENLSAEVQDLLLQLLDKNPETRMTLDEMREHPWITCNGTAPLPSKEDNVSTVIDEPEESEVRNAITPVNFGNITAAVKAAKKLKARAESRAKRGMSLQSGLDSDPSPYSMSNTSSPNSSRSGTINLSELTNELQRQTSSPQPRRPGPSTTQTESDRHSRNASVGSVDDNFLEKVRYVEDELGQSVVERGPDLDRVSATSTQQYKSSPLSTSTPASDSLQSTRDV